MKKFLVGLVCTLLSASTFAQDVNLSEAAFKLIQAAVFEVVVDKAPDERLVYDKKLDMDDVPFKERNDAYESIGTAFAISATEVATAFHVINLSENSMVYKKFYIRDAQGNVNEIDKITAASNERDVLTCTVKNRTFKTHLNFEQNWTVGKTAFTVGNSLGEGIVVRQGLILGTIPEEISGRWDILKTSADSSPGNSGGPLITSNGLVLGVVVSRKDNIQYTVPAKVLKETPRNELKYWHKSRVSHAVLANKLSVTYEASLPLPADYQTLRESLCAEIQTQYVASMEQLFAEAPEYLSGNNDLYLMDFSPSGSFPEVDFVDGNNDNWTLSEFKTNTARLPDDGQMSTAKLSSFSVAKIKKPRSSPLTQINTDPKYIVDLILKNSKSVRNFWGSDYRILSYGEPLSTGQYKDAQGKTWITVEWLIDYCDNIYILYILPLPSGPVMVSTLQYSSERDMYQWDIKKVCDHIHAAYASDFKNWTEFLSVKEYIPTFLQNFKFLWKTGAKEFGVQFDQVSIKADDAVFSWTDSSEIFLTLCYYQSDAGVKYGIDYISFEQDGIKNNYFYLRRNFQPNPDLGRKYLDKWNDILKRGYPYDNKPYLSSDNNTGAIGAIIDAKQPSSNLRYAVFLKEEDPANEDDINARFAALLKDILIIR
jgi:hypothetical protein